MRRFARSCPQFSGRQQAIRPREPDEGGLYRARSRSRARFYIPSLGASTCWHRLSDAKLHSSLSARISAVSGWGGCEDNENAEEKTSGTGRIARFLLHDE